MGNVPEEVAVSSDKSGIARRAQIATWRSHPAYGVRAVFIVELERQRRERATVTQASARVSASRTPRVVLPRSPGRDGGAVYKLDKCNIACTGCTTCTTPRAPKCDGSGARRRTRSWLQTREGVGVPPMSPRRLFPVGDELCSGTDSTRTLDKALCEANAMGPSDAPVGPSDAPEGNVLAFPSSAASAMAEPSLTRSSAESECAASAEPFGALTLLFIVLCMPMSATAQIAPIFVIYLLFIMLTCIPVPASPATPVVLPPQSAPALRVRRDWEVLARALVARKEAQADAPPTWLALAQAQLDAASPVAPAASAVAVETARSLTLVFPPGLGYLEPPAPAASASSAAAGAPHRGGFAAAPTRSGGRQLRAARERRQRQLAAGELRVADKALLRQLEARDAADMEHVPMHLRHHYVRAEPLVMKHHGRTVYVMQDERGFYYTSGPSY